MTRSVGTRLPRLEDNALLRGRGRFVDDIEVPGVLHAAFARSPHPHAAILNVDAAVAGALPGVAAVLTLDDLAPVLTQRRMARPSNSGTRLDLCWPFALADREVSYVGEAVALVLADSRYTAEDAAALVAVDYDVLPASADVRRAMGTDAPPVRRELAGNLVTTFKAGYGDIDAAFATAVHVFSQDIAQHRGGAHPIEGRGLVVERRASDGALTVWASTQKTNDLHATLVSLVRLDEGLLRVVAPDVGGGFGPKLCVYSEDVACVAAATLLARSVKWIEDRREHFTNAVQERDQHWAMEIALDVDGRVLGLRGHMVHDQGAYALQDVNLPYNSVSAVTGPYVVPALAMRADVVLTNKGPVSSVRGAGYPQAAFAMERLMDLAADRLGLDRAEIRRRNLIPADKMPYEKPLKARSGSGIVYDSGDYPACQTEVLAAAGWDDFRARQEAARAAGRHIGLGLANAVKGTGRGPYESGIVKIAPSGRVSVFTGAAAMGQGIATALAQICADELGLAPSAVTVVAGDTALAPLGLGGFASRQLVTAGSSVRLAAQAVAAKARRLASHMLEASEDDLVFAEGRVAVAGAPQLGVPLGELSRVLQGAPGYGFPDGLTPGLDAAVNWRTDALAYANTCHAAEVEVDIETGGVTLVRYVALQDSGRLVNPLIVDGQVQGGIVHGVSNALFEWMGYDAGGQPLTTTFADYLLPTAPEVPMIETRYRESPSPLNPLGAKGVGEVSTIPAAAAVIAAIEDALSPFGVTINRQPVTPPMLREMIERGMG